MIFFGVDIKYKGAFKSEDQLSKGELPPNAVKITGRDTLSYGAPPSCLFWIFVGFILLALAMLIYAYPECAILLCCFVIWTPIGLITHELLHALCYGKGAKVEIYNMQSRCLFVYSTGTITKTRSIVLYLLPSFLLGWVPLIVWVSLSIFYNFSINPFVEASISVFSIDIFIFFMILGSVSDYVGVYRLLRQMPKGSVEQLSGLSTYWFMPEK